MEYLQSGESKAAAQAMRKKAEKHLADKQAGGSSYRFTEEAMGPWTR